MPTNTYTPLATITLASAASSVTFASIPATYRDLILVCDWAGSASANYLELRFNTDNTSSNYPIVAAYGSSGGVGSYTANGMLIGVARTTRNPTIAQIFDYSATDKHKNMLSRYGLQDMSEVAMHAGRWANTAAINTVKAQLSSGTISVGSTFSLWGIA